MRALVATLGLLLLLPGRAGAQVEVAPPPQPVSPYGSPAAQSASATSYLLTMCMVQLASQGNPPSQADIDTAAHDYFTNGAAVTAVPAGSGLGGTYFRNGAAVLGVPGSGPVAEYFNNGAPTTAYPSPAFGAYGTPVVPEEAGAPTVTAKAESALPPGPAEALEPDAGVPPPPPAEGQPAPARAAGLACSPSELEAAMAIGREYAVAAEPAAPSPEPLVSPAAGSDIAVPAKAGPASPASHPSHTARKPSTAWGVGLAISGALLATASGMLSMRYRLQRRRRR
jgi:hypothetical protein